MDHDILATLVGRAAQNEFRRARMMADSTNENNIYSNAAKAIMERYADEESPHLHGQINDAITRIEIYLNGTEMSPSTNVQYDIRDLIRAYRQVSEK